MTEIVLNKESAKESALHADLHSLPWGCQPGVAQSQVWVAWALSLHDWMQRHGFAARDVVVLLPQIAHLQEARLAWSLGVGGWMPQLETVGTLLDRLPASEPVFDEDAMFTLDARVDALRVSGALAAQAVRHREFTLGLDDADERAFAVNGVIECGHAWLKAWLSLSPLEQSHMLLQAQDWLKAHLDSTPPGPGAAPMPGATEQWLVCRALRWALASAPTLNTQRAALFAHRPVAWVAVTVGQAAVAGSESRLMLSVLRHAQTQGIPVCWMPASLAPAANHDTPLPNAPRLFKAADAQDEAHAAAAMVLQAVNEARLRGEAQPVALVAQDRLLTRRVRAMLMPLEDQGQLVLADESGWTLSTTRAAAAVSRLLAAAQARSSADDVLDWLLCGWVDAQVVGGVDALEQAWRQQGVLGPWDDALVESQAHPAWMQARAILAPLRHLQSRQGRHQGATNLHEALAVLETALRACGAWERLACDEAGVCVIDTLHLGAGDEFTEPDGPAQPSAWRMAAQATPAGLHELTRWVKAALEAATFMPGRPTQAADIVIAPLSRLALRPFAAVILPGADDAHLGVASSSRAFFSPQTLHELGLPLPQQQRHSQWEAFALLACAPGVVALSRRVDQGESRAPSPWLARWWWVAFGRLLPQSWPQALDPRAAQAVAVALPQRPEPMLQSGHDSLAPRRLSASAYEQLRACPYRYFALSVLGLRDLDELDEGLDAADYGSWLHAVLKQYHEARGAAPAPASEAAEVAAWLEVAQTLAQQMGLLGAGRRAYFGLHQVTLPALALGYVQWVREQEAQGWQWAALERQLSSQLALPGGDWSVELYGELDRIDTRAAADGMQWRVIDYKTGAVQGLKDKLKEPLEDTQLAFYTLLASQPWHAGMHDDSLIEAQYLRVHPDAVTVHAHPDARASAEQLRQGVATDMARLRQSHPMRALGEGKVCDHCEARGLCRKDRWPPHTDTPASMPAQGDDA